MLRRLCRFAPLLGLVLPLAGCFDTHGGTPAPLVDGGSVDGGSGGGTCDCCGTPVGIGPGETCLSGVCDPYCGIVHPDAGPGPSCAAEPASIDLACFSHVTAGRPFELPVLIGGEDGCFCGEEVTCAARVESEGVLVLETGLCPGLAICEACNPFVAGTCALPPLDAGTWRVRVNGTDAWELEVTSPDVLPERGAQCVRRADDGGACGNAFPPSEYAPSRACHPSGAYVGERVPIRVVDPCGGCATVAGPCEVSVFDDVIRVHAERVSIGCDVDCPAICTEREDVCWTPPLEAGTWTVVFDGLVTTDDRPPTTITVAGAPPGGEACAGALVDAGG